MGEILAQRNGNSARSRVRLIARTRLFRTRFCTAVLECDRVFGIINVPWHEDSQYTCTILDLLDFKAMLGYRLCLQVFRQFLSMRQITFSKADISCTGLFRMAMPTAEFHCLVGLREKMLFN